MTIGAIAELKSIDAKSNSLFKALQIPHLHRIASLMSVERLKLHNITEVITHETKTINS